MIDDPLNRLSVLRGEDLPWSKLDEETVRKARRDYERARLVVQRIQSQYSIKGMAKKYGVHHRTMHKALTGETWSHIP